jgi:hypothetical protein
MLKKSGGRNVVGGDLLHTSGGVDFVLSVIDLAELFFGSFLDIIAESGYAVGMMLHR